ncbi:MAG: hypothetical protein KUG75_02000 [Pseudomonadales bacterium]|nr:hypothetical protein [Pseudomonadales bacterium]
MKALVIGGTGPTGPFVVNGLLARGYETAILHTGNHEVDSIPEEVEHIHTNPFDEEATKAALGNRSFDLVIAMYGRLRMLAPLFKGRTNRFISVGGVPIYKGYGRPTTVFPPGLPVPTREDAPKAGTEEVGKVLRIIETEECVFQHHPEATHFRYPLIYGPEQLLPREWLIVRRILDKRSHIIVPDAGLTLRTAAYGENAAHALLLAIDKPNAAQGNVYNVGDETTLTVKQTIEVVAQALDHELEIISIPLEYAPSALPLLGTSWTYHRLTDANAIRTELGYRDVLPVKEALTRSARWLVDNPPEKGGREEKGLQDPFDYAFEDRLVAAWQNAMQSIREVNRDSPISFRDRYADGRRGEENAKS